MKVVNEHEIEKVTCPGCKANIEIEREKPTHRIIESEREMPISEFEAMLDKKLDKLKPAAVAPPAEKKKPTIKAPAHIKKGKCKNCNNLHDNEDYVGPATGKCDKCGSIFTDRAAGDCPFCKGGEIDKLDEDDRADMELYDEGPEGHDHD